MFVSVWYEYAGETRRDRQFAHSETSHNGREKTNRSREEKKKRHKRLHNCADTESVIEVDSRRNYRAAFPPPPFFVVVFEQLSTLSFLV